MSLGLYNALGLADGYDYVRTDLVDGAIKLYVAVREDQFVCPACGSWEVCRRTKRFREIMFGAVEAKSVFLVAEVPRCQCPVCGNFFEVSPPLRKSPDLSPST